jgi:hypothetical protein
MAGERGRVDDWTYLEKTVHEQGQNRQIYWVEGADAVI